MSQSSVEFSVSEFVSVFNQTLEYAYGGVVIYGELANFRVAKDKWVYFDLKDEGASVSFFGTVYNLPGPLEEGMMLKVRGMPKLHPRWGFSVSVASISPAGSGTIKRLSDLLKIQLQQEGLFALERKRLLPYPPQHIGLITSTQSAAYADFIRIISNRWAGLDIETINVSVQGDQAVEEIIEAIKLFSALPKTPEVLVIIRGGGSPEDLAAFNNEMLVRAVAASRVPTLIAIGHEIDVSLAELAADKRASTPSNAAEVLVPDKKAEMARLSSLLPQLRAQLAQRLKAVAANLNQTQGTLHYLVKHKLELERIRLSERARLIAALSPKDILKRGYAIVFANGSVSDGSTLKPGSIVSIEMSRAAFTASILKKAKGTTFDGKS
ncbi:MAG: exodeoxyribonuclease VII large subunit [Candidatus Saccharimonadales bacterium]